MPRIVEKELWSSDPFLRRITSHRDFDGWYSYFTIKDPTPTETKVASNVDIQFSQDGVTWSSVGFEEKFSFIDFVSFAWEHSLVFDGLAPESLRWRALIND
jgi:hypothetical protein